MKRSLIMLMSIAMVAASGGCAKQIRQESFESPEHRVLYDLLVERCKAVSAGDMEALRRLYTKESSELKWLAGRINYLSTFTFDVTDVKKISIVGVDAAGQFAVNVFPSTVPYREVDVLYLKEGSLWKIESVAETLRR